jgi:hypothetical protein
MWDGYGQEHMLCLSCLAHFPGSFYWDLEKNSSLCWSIWTAFHSAHYITVYVLICRRWFIQSASPCSSFSHMWQTRLTAQCCTRFLALEATHEGWNISVWSYYVSSAGPYIYLQSHMVMILLCILNKYCVYWYLQSNNLIKSVVFIFYLFSSSVLWPQHNVSNMYVVC